MSIDTLPPLAQPPCPQCGREDPWYNKTGPLTKNFCVHCSFAPTENPPPVPVEFPSHCPKCEAPDPWQWQTGKLWENWCARCGYAPPIPPEEIPEPDPYVPDPPKKDPNGCWVCGAPTFGAFECFMHQSLFDR